MKYKPLFQIENLKKELEKKQEEIESLTKQNSGMRSTIDRLDREKVLLNTKLKNAQKSASKQPPKKDPADTKVTQVHMHAATIVCQGVDCGGGLTM